MKVLTGIVTFNPSITRLRENLDAVKAQETDLLIFDNGSDNYKNIEKLCSDAGCVVHRVNENQGIAYGLRYIMDYAIQNHYDWVLSLDQDSICDTGLIAEYKKYIHNPHIGALTCNIKDRNFVEVGEQIIGG